MCATKGTVGEIRSNAQPQDNRNLVLQAPQRLQMLVHALRGHLGIKLDPNDVIDGHVLRPGEICARS
jgi:hypothetical protein